MIKIDIYFIVIDHSATNAEYVENMWEISDICGISKLAGFRFLNWLIFVVFWSREK